MTMLYPNLYLIEVCYKETALYVPIIALPSFNKLDPIFFI